MVGQREPETLLVSFVYWTTDEQYQSRMASVDDPRYIEGGKYTTDTWQRVRIPLIDLGIIDQKFQELDISSCAWPCTPNRSVDDIYIDDIQLDEENNRGQLPCLLLQSFAWFLEQKRTLTTTQFAMDELASTGPWKAITESKLCAKYVGVTAKFQMLLSFYLNR